jgi:uncharacterized membrane protein
MKTALILSLILIIASFAINYYFYPMMPEKMISHWGIDGGANGYSSRLFGMLIMPIVSVAMLLLFLIIPNIDPLKKNIKKFRQYFDYFILVMMIFMVYINSLVIAANLGVAFDMNIFITPALALLFFGVGVLTSNAKMNWSIGVRTPWTLSSEQVWDKTNKRTGFLFKICGILCLAGLIFPRYTFFFIFFPIMFTAAYSFVYSYLLYKRIKK